MVDQKNQVRGNQFIAGVESRAGSRFFMGADPRTKEAGQTQFANATAAEIDRAVQAALVALEQNSPQDLNPSPINRILTILTQQKIMQTLWPTGNYPRRTRKKQRRQTNRT